MNQNTLPELSEEMMHSLFNQGMARHAARQARRRVVVSSLAGVALMVGIGIRLMSPVAEEEGPIVAENHIPHQVTKDIKVIKDTKVPKVVKDLKDLKDTEAPAPTETAPATLPTAPDPGPIYELECNDHNACDYLYVAAAFDHLLNINNA